jgi:hypothetical protein
MRSTTTGDRRTTRLRAAALALLFACTPAAAAAQSAFPPDSAIQALLEQRVTDGRAAGIVLGLIDADGSTRILSAGTAGPGRTLGGESIFEIGSITKVFTGVLLADMGRRGLEDPPQADRSSTRVRIAQRGGDAGETVSSARDAPEPGLSFESRALAVEPAGVEPASANRSLSTSTCVVRLIVFSLDLRRDGQPFTSQPLCFLTHGAVTSPRASPIQSSPESWTSGRVPASDGRVRFSYAASAMLSLALVGFFRCLTRVTETSARSTDFTKHVEAVSAPTALKLAETGSFFNPPRAPARR